MTPVKINIQMPTQDAQGNVQLSSSEVTIVLETVYFIHKQPLQPAKVIACLVPTPLITHADIEEEKLKAAGFKRFETPEGSYAWVNTREAIFAMSPELGIYVFVFPGGSKVGVRATGEEIDKAMGLGGSIIA